MNSDPPPSAGQLKLQKNIRTMAASFMQDNMIGLQALPSEEHYKKLQEARKVEIQQRIALERQAATEHQERERKDMQGKQPIVNNPPKRQTDHQDQPQKKSGWIPQEMKINYSNTDDPMVQQMNIIKGYIKQAKQAEKHDEVKMLEQNLQDLQQEYMRQQRQNWS